MTQSNRPPNDPHSALRVFQIGGVVTIGLAIVENLFGFGPLGGSVLAELGVIFGSSFFIAEVFFNRARK